MDNTQMHTEKIYCYICNIWNIWFADIATDIKLGLLLLTEYATLSYLNDIPFYKFLTSPVQIKDGIKETAWNSTSNEHLGDWLGNGASFL